MNSDDDLRYSDNRVLTSLSVGIEKKILLCLSRKIPKYIMPDMLTIFGLFAMICVGLSYYFVSYHWLFFISANVGLILNWFGDSLDGTIARVRNQSRPKYGYYFDHLVDTFGISFMIFGLAYSKLVSQPFAWLALVLFLIASINTYLAANTLNVFNMSYLKLSITEGRILLIIMNTVLIFVKKITIFDFQIFLVDLIACLVSVFLLFVTLKSAAQNLRKLDREEKAQWSMIKDI